MTKVEPVQGEERRSITCNVAVVQLVTNYRMFAKDRPIFNGRVSHSVSHGGSVASAAAAVLVVETATCSDSRSSWVVKLKGVVVEEALFDPLERTYSYSLQLGWPAGFSPQQGPSCYYAVIGIFIEANDRCDCGEIEDLMRGRIDGQPADRVYVESVESFFLCLTFPLCQKVI
ncbi:hypothetical protein P167DRAFT_561813 [Morchella conica CCBAS932]|uniref:Uncharacterized protein n=1 Tax=Morchella conica CCBAS932 TaxID=1392247 RepID=A0A3N4LFW4_9PEZI|nr:hypothetical protein P167DRAFT_561813 [Morchella conica CCBAS932]